MPPSLIGLVFKVGLKTKPGAFGTLVRLLPLLRSEALPGGTSSLTPATLEPEFTGEEDAWGMVERRDGLLLLV